MNVSVQLARVSSLVQWFSMRYRSLLSISEIENSTTLQWAFGAMVFAYFIAFNAWLYNRAMTVDVFRAGQHICWPYFQSCGEWLFLHAVPAYSQTTFYMVLFGTLLAVVYFMFRRQWIYAHLALLPSFIWHGLGVFVFTMSLSGNYEYYLFILSFILLFIPHKLFFLQLALVFFYVLSTVAKIHESWTLGAYFSSLKYGLPIFPDWSIPLLTNLVISMEMVGAWFLMARKGVAQRSVLGFFVLFHLYSGTLVGYRYPATVLPTLFIVFGPLYQKLSVPIDRRSFVGWTLIALMLFMQFTPRMIAGDEKLTLEGNQFGLYMFEANHQCRWVYRVHKNDGSVTSGGGEDMSARNRCDPYRAYFSLKTQCERERGDIKRIALRFDHSVNGGPFLRIVDEADVCSLIYEPFRHNHWIKTEKDDPAIIGLPVQNIYQ